MNNFVSLSRESMARALVKHNHDELTRQHVERVSRLVPDRLVVPTLLHDIVEDTSITVGHVDKFFGHDVADLVNILSRREGESYASYIQTVISGGEDAIAIKLADIQDHFDQADTLSDSLRERYEAAREILMEVLDNE